MNDEHGGFLINEAYPCLQGEGRNTGMPSFLIRFQNCNLRCQFCDTPYTHTAAPDTKSDNRPEVTSLERIVAGIKRQRIIRNIIFTGGEPALQPFQRILNSLDSSYTAEVETNATIIPHAFISDFKETDYERFQWNLSPKFRHFGGKIVKRAISFWAEKSKQLEHIYFKFVVSEKRMNQDMFYILKLIQDYDLYNRQVYLMPEGTHQASQVKNRWLHDICLKFGFNYSSRLHVILFGNKRGV